VGEEESNKIPAGENILVIKTPKGLYVRTKTGRIYAVNSGNQFNSSGGSNWRIEQPMMPHFQQSSPLAYAAESPRSLFDPWLNSNSGGDVYNSVRYNNVPGVTSVLNGDPYAARNGDPYGTRNGNPYNARYFPQFSSAQSFPQCGLGNSSDTPSKVSNIDPASFLNITAASGDGNYTWNSSVAHQSMGRMMSNEASSNTEAPLSWMQQPQVYKDDSRFTANSTVQRPSSYVDLPSDLLCIDASSVTTDRTDVSASALPALTVRDTQNNDSDSLNSLTFDDCGSFSYNSSSSTDPVFNNYEPPMYSMHSDVSATATSLFSNATASTGAVDIGDISDEATDWNELSAMMNDMD